MTIEEMLQQSGDFGPAQWWLLTLFCATNILSAFHYFALTFISLTPPVLCSSNQTSVDFGSDAESDWNGFQFKSITMELGWTCENEGLKATFQAMFFVGSITGTLILGILADMFGRLPMLAVANLLAITGNILTVYVKPTIWLLGLARFIAGLATDTNFFMMYIIVMEYIRPSLRTFGLNLCIGVWYCVGCMLTPWIAIWTGEWRSFLLTISVPMLAIPVSCLFVPESAQWLLSRGKVESAIKCFKKVAILNRKEISSEFIAQFKSTSVDFANTSNNSASLTGLFKTPKLRKKTSILIFKTLVLSLCYDAISRNIEGLGLDPFSMFTITSASIFPSCLVILLFQDKVGRKAMAVFALLLTGITNFGQGGYLAISNDLSYANAIIGLLGRFFVNIAYNSGTQYSAELIPTQVRGQGLAAVHVIGYTATFCSPYILLLAKTWIATPEVILGSLSILGAICCLFLPETLHKALPVTLEDGENFGEDESIWDFLKMKVKHVPSTIQNTKF